MAMFLDFFDRSKQVNRASKNKELKFEVHGPINKYKIIHLSLIIPNLPAPIRYLNFFSLVGIPDSILFNQEQDLKNKTLNIAQVFTSISPHLIHTLNTYDKDRDCVFAENGFQFLDREKIEIKSFEFYFERQDTELSYQLTIKATNIISCFTKLRLDLADYWSAMCSCEGEVIYKNQKIQIKQFGALEFARSVNFPNIPFAFFVKQTINLKNERQLICIQIRNHHDEIIQSRIFLRDFTIKQSQMFDGDIHFNIHRVYPKIKTPNQQEIYLPREFTWEAKDLGGDCIEVTAQSRGDYKYGLGNGFVGSFIYQVKINNEEIEEGEGGYIEYIDCRNLKFQEQNKNEYKLNPHTETALCLAKK